MRSLLGALIVVGLGCGEGVSPVVESPVSPVSVTPPSTRVRLESDVVSLRIDPLTALGRFTARQVLADLSSPVPVTLTDGWFEAYAQAEGSGHQLIVTRLSASLGDVKFSEEQLPPNGLTLTRVHFALTEPAQLSVRWIGDGNLGWAKGFVTVDLHTSMLLSTGAESPLQVARLHVPVELTVSQTANGLMGLWLQVAREGALWNGAGLFELSDLQVSLEAFETKGVDQLPPHVELN